MTIDEAIEFLDEWLPFQQPCDDPRAREALRLGIEALKLVKEFRTGCYKTINSPLLGEIES